MSTIRECPICNAAQAGEPYLLGGVKSGRNGVELEANVCIGRVIDCCRGDIRYSNEHFREAENSIYEITIKPTPGNTTWLAELTGSLTGC